MLWNEIDNLESNLLAKFGDDEFLEVALLGTRRVAQDARNPIRGNLTASGLREIAGHILQNLAPDEEVREAIWFEQSTDTPTVTRRQKAGYILRAGLPTEFVMQQLHLNIEEETSPIVEAINSLHRITHVRPETLLNDEAKTASLIRQTLQSIVDLIELSEESRQHISELVAESLHNAVFEDLISETIQELDELSTHTVVDHHMIEEISTIELNSKTAKFYVVGIVEVELQYGSGSDVRHGIGLITGDNYPYEASISSDISDLLSTQAHEVQLQVDTSSFYE